MELLPVKVCHLKQVANIYNHAIKYTTATFDTEPTTAEVWQKLLYEDALPFFIAEEDQHVLAWCRLSPYSTKKAFSSTVEISTYVDHRHTGRGIGGAVTMAAIRAGLTSQLHTAVAKITAGNSQSLNLFHKLGFEHTGRIKQAGYKFDKYFDVEILQAFFSNYH
tara:strand:- start:851 stop:1342 length:492 start_codon:yes stop_codon:yes gene_type:complete